MTHIGDTEWWDAHDSTSLVVCISHCSPSSQNPWQSIILYLKEGRIILKPTRSTKQRSHKNHSLVTETQYISKSTKILDKSLQPRISHVACLIELVFSYPHIVPHSRLVGRGGWPELKSPECRRAMQVCVWIKLQCALPGLVPRLLCRSLWWLRCLDRVRSGHTGDQAAERGVDALEESARVAVLLVGKKQLEKTKTIRHRVRNLSCDLINQERTIYLGILKGHENQNWGWCVPHHAIYWLHLRDVTLISTATRDENGNQSKYKGDVEAKLSANKTVFGIWLGSSCICCALRHHPRTGGNMNECF